MNIQKSFLLLLLIVITSCASQKMVVEITVNSIKEDNSFKTYSIVPLNKNSQQGLEYSRHEKELEKILNKKFKLSMNQLREILYEGFIIYFIDVSVFIYG